MPFHFRSLSLNMSLYMSFLGVVSLILHAICCYPDKRTTILYRILTIMNSTQLNNNI